MAQALARTSAIPAAAAPSVRRGRPTLSNEQLLDKALDLFLDQGFDRTSIEAICAAAGMAKRTVYARYADKTSLFRAAMERAIAEWIIPPERLKAMETGDLEGSLLAVGRILVNNLLSPAGQRLLRLTSAVAAQMPEIGAMNVRLGTEPTLEYLTDLIARKTVDWPSPAPDAGLTARAFLDLVVGGPSNASAWGVQAEPAEIERHMRFRIHMMVRGLEPRGGDLRALTEENQSLRERLASAAAAAAALSQHLAADDPA